MRKIILASCFLAALCSAPAYAQLGEQRQNFSIGANAGYNFTNVSFIPSFKQSTKEGLVGGFTMRYISEKYFAMICGAQIELNYSQLGWKEQMEPGDTRSYNRTMNYIEIPFLAHLAFGRDFGLQGFINAGPQIAYMLSESADMSDNYFRTDNYNQLSNGEKAAKEEITTRFDYGLAAGAGFEVRTRKLGSFILEGRYYLGFGDFFQNGKAATFERSAFRNIVIKATYLFDITR